MGCSMANLTTLGIRNLKPGPKTKRYGDSRGLYIVVRANGSKAWVQRITIDGDRTDLGLGGYPDLPLALARTKSAELRTAVAEGRDPRAERRQPNLPTFQNAAEQYISDNAARWKNPKEAVNWRGSLATYAYPMFGSTRIDRISRADVLAALKPVWTSKPSIARKLRQRVRAVFAAAMAHGHIDLNPAGEVIDAALPKTPSGQGPLSGTALPRRRICPPEDRGVLCVLEHQVVSAVPRCDGGTVRRGAWRSVG